MTQQLPTITLNNNQIHIQSHDKNTCFIVTILSKRRKIRLSGDLPQNTKLLKYSGNLYCKYIGKISVRMSFNKLTMTHKHDSISHYENIIDFNKMSYRFDITIDDTGFLRKRSPSYSLNIDIPLWDSISGGNIDIPSGVGYDTDKDKTVITVCDRNGRITKCVHFRGSKKLFKMTLDKDQHILEECLIREGDLDNHTIHRRSGLGTLFVYMWMGSVYKIITPPTYIDRFSWTQCYDKSVMDKILRLSDIDECDAMKWTLLFPHNNDGTIFLTDVKRGFFDCVINTET